MASLDARLGDLIEPFRRAVALLITIPGVGDVVARVIVAEIGIDMARFPTAGHLRSWAGLSPGLRESAGKRLSTRTRRGGWLKTTLVQAAWAAVRHRHTYLHAQFVRLRARPRREEGHPRRRGLDPHCGLSHAPARGTVH